MLSPPSACPFAPRCRYEVEQSREQVPPLEELEPGHRVACFNPVPPTSGSARARGGEHGRRTALVEVEDLKVWFPIKSGLVLDRHVGDVKAVDGVSLTIERGETLGLVGESGCGKSTLGARSCGLYEPTGGPIVFDGQDITHLREAELRPLRRRMQMIFQDPYASLNPRHSSGASSASRCACTGSPTGARRTRGARAARGRRPARGRATRYPHEFSGGQRQRIGLARALALNPDFIVCDEPVSALDVSIQAQIVNLLESLQHEFDLTYLFIAHDLAVVRHISDRIAVMYLGKIVEVVAGRRPLRQPAPPVHDLAALGDPDPRSRRRAAARDDPAPGRPAEPGEPAAACRFHTRCPYVQPTRCRDEVPELRDSTATSSPATGRRRSRPGSSPQRIEPVFEPWRSPRRAAARRASPIDRGRSAL